jgi:HEAT repeat protein
VQELAATGEDAVRHAAVNALVNFPSASVTVPEMKKLLASSDATRVERAALVLQRLGPKAGETVPDLIRAARRSGAPNSGPARALTAIGFSAVEPLLLAAEFEPLEAMTEEHWVVRCLAGMGPDTAPLLSAALGQTNASVRLAALETLRLQGREVSPASEAVAGLLRAEPPKVRARALAALLATTSRTATLLPHIQAAIRDADSSVRAAATAAVGELGAEGESCVPLLIEALGDPELPVRLNSAKALGGLGEKAGPAADALTAQLAQRDPAYRVAVIDALGRIGPAAAPGATPVLVETVESGPVEQRLAALRALGEFGAKAQGAGSSVCALASHSTPEIRAAALRAASRIVTEPDAVLPLLSTGLEDPEPAVRLASAEAAGRFGEKAQEQAPRLFEMLQRKAERAAALDSLRQIKSKSVPLYVGALSNEDASVRLFACESLGGLGSAAAEAVPALRKALNDSSGAVRRQARSALRAIEGEER